MVTIAQHPILSSMLTRPVEDEEEDEDEDQDEGEGDKGQASSRRYACGLESARSSFFEAIPFHHPCTDITPSSRDSNDRKLTVSS
jgi:hypothetical protein